MAPLSPRLVVPIDIKKKPWEQKHPLHNRWHPHIPAVAEVTEGEVFRVEMMDWSGGSVADNDSAMDIKSIDLAIVSTQFLTPMGPTELHVNPIFEIGPVEPRFSEWLVFEGISVDERGEQHFMDATVAYKRAVLNAIDYLSKFGYSKEQAYLLLSCCPCEGRLSGIVDIPNAVATIAIPTAIFDQDIRPKAGRVPVGPRVVKRLPDVIRCSYDGDLPITQNASKAK